MVDGNAVIRDGVTVLTLTDEEVAQIRRQPLRLYLLHILRNDMYFSDQRVYDQFALRALSDDASWLDAVTADYAEQLRVNKEMEGQEFEIAVEVLTKYLAPFYRKYEL